ncbi:MAG: helix-turn-helix domain-containing protein [Candidatus Omnitrophota bacterium]
MAGEDIIMMTQGELKKLHVIRKAIDKTITQAEAAEVLGITTRHVRRLIKNIRIEGEKGIVHKNQGKPSNRARSNKIMKKLLSCAVKNTKISARH